MSAPLVYHHTPPPALLPLYGKALLPKSGKNHPPEAVQIPRLEASLLGVTTDIPALRDYMKVCNFQPGTRLPVTWPHILAFPPLHLKLLTEPAFPLPLLGGLVHLRNSITQHRPLAAGENLDLKVILDNQKRTDRGAWNLTWLRKPEPQDA